MARVVAIGACYLDVIFAFPDENEVPWPDVDRTSFSTSAEIMIGGKGFNQAVAAARLEADVTFITHLADGDPMASMIVGQLDREGIESEFFTGPGDVQPVALFTKGDDDTRHIASRARDYRTIDRNFWASAEVRRILRDADSVLVTNDFGNDSLQALLEVLDATPAKTRVTLLNPAPDFERERFVSASQACSFDWVVPNVREARMLARKPNLEAEQLAEALVMANIRTACVTLGSRGLVFAKRLSDDKIQVLPLPPVAVMVEDTTAASDVFCAALAAWLAAGSTDELALDAARVSAALACEETGSSRSAPVRDRVIRRMRAEGFLP